jgi:hypothetical protein
MVRDPIDRALSQIRMNAKNQKIDLASASLDQWMALATDPVIYTRARYSEFIPLWRETFGGEGILILRYTDVSKRPMHVLTQTEYFLGIGSGKYAEVETPIHASVNKLTVPPKHVTTHLNEQLAYEQQYVEQMQFS